MEGSVGIRISHLQAAEGKSVGVQLKTSGRNIRGLHSLLVARHRIRCHYIYLQTAAAVQSHPVHYFPGVIQCL